MIKRFLPKSEFSRNVLTLMTGTTISQAIPIAISPILTRIYSPEDFGIFALYMSIASIIAVISTGRYELAIMLPKKDEDAINLLVLSIGISFFISFICLVIVFLFNSEISSLFKDKAISAWLYFIPLTVMLTGVFQSITMWQNRLKKYNCISTSRVLQRVTTASTTVSIGSIIKSPIGLVSGNILGQFVSTCFLSYKTFKHDKKNILNSIRFSKIKDLSKRYKKFPMFDALAALFNMSSHQSTNIFFNMFFGTVSAGYYYLVQRIFGLPILLIASSVQDVFKEKMTKIYNDNGDTRAFFIKTFKQLFLLALLPTIFIYFFSVDIFVIFFGSQWEMAGAFVQILTPAFFLRFISFPLSFMFYIAEKQHYNIIGQFILLVMMITVLLIGKHYDTTITVKLISIVTSVFYLTYLYLSYRFTSKGVK